MNAHAAAELDQDTTARPLGGYAALLGIYAGLFGAAFALTRPRAMAVGDIALLGVATHKLARILTKDAVTSPLRAPFVVPEGRAGAGEVDESPGGEGLVRAVGELVSCPFCAAPWVAGALGIGLAVAPRATRFVAGVLATVTVSDFLNQAYAAARKAT